MKYFLILFLISPLAFALGDDNEDLDEVFEIIEEETLDFSKPLKEVEPPQRQDTKDCRCQCLTEGVTPKKKVSWRGKMFDGKCVCACLTR